MRFWIQVLITVFLGHSAVARVFDINKEKFASYLRAQYAPSNIKQTIFQNASNNNETYSGSMDFTYGGEFGFVYASRFVSMRFGLEVIRPPTLKVTASDSSGSELYSISSDLSAVIPKVGFEFNLKQTGQSRIFLNANYGSANLGMVNTYTFTSAGTTATGKSDYTEDGRGTATSLDGSLGFETLMTDTTTMVFDVGYRSLKFTTISHNRDTDSLAQGSVAKGTQMLNADGSARTLDFTGYFASLSFRFWVF